MDEVISINQKILELQKQSADLQKKNRPVIVAELREKMLAYSISAKELTAPANKGRKVKASTGDVAEKKVREVKANRPAPPVVAKYRGPAGETWSGRGGTPKWLKAQIEEGKSKEQFLIAT